MVVPRVRSAFAAAATLAFAAFATGCGGDDDPTNPGGNGGGPTPTGVVSGTVVDDAGAGVGSVGLRLTATGQTPQSATTNASGAYSFPSVPVGTWTLEITVPDAFELASGSTTRSVTVTDGGTATANFTLELFQGETVLLVDNAFQPDAVTVDAGTEIRWRATTSTFHTVTPDGHSQFTRTESQSTGTKLRATFATPGTYRYFCEPHRSAGMTGEVVVN